MSRPTRRRPTLAALFGLLSLVLLTTGGGFHRGALVHCSSSYIDDYFLPSAKIALNKLQQSLSPAGPDVEATRRQPNSLADAPTAGPDQGAEATGPQTAAGPSPNSSNELQKTASDPPRATSEPNANEFVPLEVRPDGESLRPNLIDVSQRNKPDAVLTVSSTEASADELATSSGDGDSSSAAASPEPDAATTEVSADSAEVVSVSDEPAPATSAATDAPGGAPQRAPADSGDNQVVKSADEAVLETELEAIAAVDASIGFGDAFATTADACYDEYGNARYCEPEFENVAFERQVEASSECGHPPSRFCTTHLNERNDQIRNCHICDAQHPKKRHPSAFLTDLNNPNAPTCWVSAPISAGAPTAQAGPNSTEAPPQQQQSIQRDNVTLTINLDKRYEITYMSLQFCSLRPDSLAIWKSADFGKTWSAYQFYSSQCARLYERPATGGVAGGRLSAESGQVEATCANSSAAGGQSGRVAFSTGLDEPADERNKQAAGGLGDKTPALQDWITATNIRVVLDRHQASWIQSSLAYSHHHQQQQQQQRPVGVGGAGGTARGNLSLAGPQRAPQALALAGGPSEQLEASLTNPSDTYNYAVSDWTVGGRCKCNGHASRCVHNAEGRLQCDCQHNTDGPDCERCLPLHHDRPWQRASLANANPCQPCSCNGHSRKCRFDPELYLLSGKRSGGVCIDCKDNTTGRHCNYCKEGFTRDHTKPMSDQNACTPCDCHPVGSLGKVCNHVTGQCPCKEGVAGLECNRCAPGYQQSSSPTEPCIKIPENDINYEPVIEAAADDEQQTSSVSHQTGAEQDAAPAAEGAADQQTAAAPPAANKPARPAARPPPDNNRIDSVISSDELGPVYEAQPTAEFDNLRPPAAGHRSRPRQHQQHQQHRGGQWYGYGRHNEYLGGAKRYRPALSQQGDELDELELMRAGPPNMRPPPADDQDDQYESGRPAAGYHRSMYYPAAGKRPGAYADYRQQFGPVRPLASLDHDQPDADQLAGGGQDERIAYGAGPDASGAIYSQPPDDANFNQIMRPRYGSRYHLQRQQQQNRRRLPHADRAQNCAGCQARTKKLNAKQFCHLDYAVRASVISKRASSDWTRFEVEIQDIFKSPSSSSLAPPPAATARPAAAPEPIQKSSSYPADAAGGAIQSDEPAAESAANRTLAGEQAANLIPGTDHPIHRLRVGSVQSVWVPTEDVACKCPRLKLHSSYLLMGMVDTRENSATSTQLDRHGVSMVWRPSLQEKLIKYQRLHSEGLCWRTAAAAAA